MSNSERWLPIIGWEGFYEVSDLGRIKSVGHGRPGLILKTRAKNKYGHQQVTLCGNGRKVSRDVAPMVLEAHCGPRPPGMVVCHNNGRADDNCRTNLRWDTQSSNVLDSVDQRTHAKAAVTVCPHGHQYTTENTYRDKYGHRKCRRCVLIRMRRYRASGSGAAA